jgi:hypothetical protein
MCGEVLLPGEAFGMGTKEKDISGKDALNRWTEHVLPKHA